MLPEFVDLSGFIHSPGQIREEVVPATVLPVLARRDLEIGQHPHTRGFEVAGVSGTRTDVRLVAQDRFMTRLHLDFEAIANRMRYRARSGVFSGNGSLHEREYLKKCRARIGTTTLVFTRDAGHHSLGWLPHPTHERCWHLSIACRDPHERDTWLRAFFGENVEHLWAMAASMELVCHVWHCRLFCDARGDALVDVDSAGLLAAKMLRPRDVGVELRPRALAA